MMIIDDGKTLIQFFVIYNSIQMASEPRKTFQNLSSQKQERITRVAMEEFSIKGFDGASINAIVGRLNIAKGSIFQYFGDKKGLFMFVFDQSVEKVKNYLRNVRDQSIDESLPVRLQKTLSAGAGFIERHPMLYRLYLRVLFDTKVPFRDEILSSLRKYSIEFLESLLETAEIRGELKETLDIKKTAFLLDAIMDRFLQARAVVHLDAGLGIFSSAPEQIEEWIQSLVTAICSGIHLKPDVLIQTPISKSNPIKKPHFLILSATEKEVSVLIKRIEHPNTFSIAYRKTISGKIEGMDVKVLITGPGVVNTSQALTASIEKDRPLLVIQTGCCGTFKETGLKIGDIAIANEEIDAQLGIESSTANVVPDPLPFALFCGQSGEYTYRYPVNSQWMEKFYQILSTFAKESGINMKKGPFVTVSTITATDDRACALFENFKAIVEQMEGSASAHISLLYDIPFVEIRGVSNMVGKRDRQSWDLPRASKNCCEAMISLIERTDLLKFD
jgi:TetR/AcrR family transcriptional regulator